MKETSLRKIKAAIISAAIIGTAIEKTDEPLNSIMQQKADEESNEARVSIHSPLSFVENLGC